MRTEHALRAGRRRGTRRIALAALPVAALVLTACGSEDPEVEAPPAAEEEPADTQPTTDDAEPTTEDPGESEEATADPQPTADPIEPTSEEPTTEEPSPEDPTTEEPPEEGIGDGMDFAQEYVEAVGSGDFESAYGMLSPESMAYFPDQETFESNGVDGLAKDLDHSYGEPQWAIRSAYEEATDSAQVVSIWGETEDGQPYAHAFAIRPLDGSSWVVDQDIIPATGANRLNWLNPGAQEDVDPRVVNPDMPISFALLKEFGDNVAVTASINDGDETSQQLNELPTDGAVMYELSDSTLEDGANVVTASWVAEDEPFIHTSATAAVNP